MNLFILAPLVLSVLVALYYTAMLLRVATGKARFKGEWGAGTAIVIVSGAVTAAYWLSTLL